MNQETLWPPNEQLIKNEKERGRQQEKERKVWERGDTFMDVRDLVVREAQLFQVREMEEFFGGITNYVVGEDQFSQRRQLS